MEDKYKYSVLKVTQTLHASLPGGTLDGLRFELFELYTKWLEERIEEDWDEGFPQNRDYDLHVRKLARITVTDAKAVIKKYYKYQELGRQKKLNQSMIQMS